MMLRSLAFAVFISIIATAGAANPNSEIDIISQYVISHKHWPANIFRVERKDCDCAYALYRIVYLPEAHKPLTANSRSFAVYYDEQLHKIVKETQFQ